MLWRNNSTYKTTCKKKKHAKIAAIFSSSWGKNSYHPKYHLLTCLLLTSLIGKSWNALFNFLLSKSLLEWCWDTFRNIFVWVFKYSLVLAIISSYSLFWSVMFKFLSMSPWNCNGIYRFQLQNFRIPFCWCMFDSPCTPKPAQMYCSINYYKCYSEGGYSFNQCHVSVGPCTQAEHHYDHHSMGDPRAEENVGLLSDDQLARGVGGQPLRLGWEFQTKQFKMVCVMVSPLSLDVHTWYVIHRNWEEHCHYF